MGSDLSPSSRSHMTDRNFNACFPRCPLVVHPCDAPLAQRSLLPSGTIAPWASRKKRFQSRNSTAYTLAYLRFIDLVATTGVRLAIGSDGLPLDRVGFAPAGRQTTLHEGIASFARPLVETAPRVEYSVAQMRAGLSYNLSGLRS